MTTTPDTPSDRPARKPAGVVEVGDSSSPWGASLDQTGRTHHKFLLTEEGD